MVSLARSAVAGVSELIERGFGALIDCACDWGGYSYGIKRVDCVIRVEDGM